MFLATRISDVFESRPDSKLKSHQFRQKSSSPHVTSPLGTHNPTEVIDHCKSHGSRKHVSPPNRRTVSPQGSVSSRYAKSENRVRRRLFVSSNQMFRDFHDTMTIPVWLVSKRTLLGTQNVLHPIALLRKMRNIFFSSIAIATIGFGNHPSTVEPICSRNSPSKSTQLIGFIQNKRVVVPWLQPTGEASTVRVQDPATMIRKILTFRGQDRRMQSLTRSITNNLTKGIRLQVQEVKGRKIQEPKRTGRIKGKSNHTTGIHEQVKQAFLEDSVVLEFNPLLEEVTVLLTTGRWTTPSGISCTRKEDFSRSPSRSVSPQGKGDGRSECFNALSWPCSDLRGESYLWNNFWNR